MNGLGTSMLAQDVAKHKGITADRAYTCFVGLYPILNRYASPLPMLSLSEFIVILFLAWGLARYKERSGVVPVAMLMFMLYLVFHVMLDLISVDSLYLADSIGTTLRLLFIYAALVLISRPLFLPSYAERIFPVFGTAIAAYGFLQIVAAQASIVLPSYIPGLPVMGSLDVDQAIEQRLDYGFRFRCQSLLNEPAALAIYLAVPIVMCLFPRDHAHERYGLAGAMSAVSCLSQSSTGIIIVGFIWVVKLITWIHSKHFDARYLVLVLLMAVVVGYVLLIPTGVLDTFVQHTFSRYGSFGLFQNSRFNEIGMAFSESDSIPNIVFGVGLHSTEFYLPGFARAYYCLGIIGLLLICSFLLVLLRNASSQNKAIVATFIVLNFGSEILFGNFVIYFLSTCMADMQSQDLKRSHPEDARSSM